MKLKSLLLLIVISFHGMALNAMPWSFVGGYVLDGTATVCLREGHNSLWLKLGQKAGDYTLIEIDPELRYIQLQNESGSHRIERAAARDTPVPVLTSPNLLFQIELLNAEELKQAADAHGVSESQLESILNNSKSLRDLTNEIVRDTVLAARGNLNPKSMRELQSNLEPLGAMVLWREGDGGEVHDMHIIAWPMHPNYAEDGSITFTPMSTDEANPYFQSVIDDYYSQEATPQGADRE